MGGELGPAAMDGTPHCDNTEMVRGSRPDQASIFNLEAPMPAVSTHDKQAPYDRTAVENAPRSIA